MTATGVAESVLENESGVQEEFETMENEAAVFKVPRIKRKNLRGDEGSNSKTKVEIDKSFGDETIVKMMAFSSGEDSESHLTHHNKIVREMGGKGGMGLRKYINF